MTHRARAPHCIPACSRECLRGFRINAVGPRPAPVPLRVAQYPADAPSPPASACQDLTMRFTRTSSGSPLPLAAANSLTPSRRPPSPSPRAVHMIHRPAQITSQCCSGTPPHANTSQTAQTPQAIPTCSAVPNRSHMRRASAVSPRMCGVPSLSTMLVLIKAPFSIASAVPKVVGVPDNPEAKKWTTLFSCCRTRRRPNLGSAWATTARDRCTPPFRSQRD